MQARFLDFQMAFFLQEMKHFRSIPRFTRRLFTVHQRRLHKTIRPCGSVQCWAILEQTRDNGASKHHQHHLSPTVPSLSSSSKFTFYWLGPELSATLILCLECVDLVFLIVVEIYASCVIAQSLKSNFRFEPSYYELSVYLVRFIFRWTCQFIISLSVFC